MHRDATPIPHVPTRPTPTRPTPLERSRRDHPAGRGLLTADHEHEHDADHDLGDEQHEHDLGLGHDLRTMAAVPRPARPMSRRRALGLLGGGSVAAVALAACQWEVSGGGYSTIPEETAGPYPGDGSNGPNALTTSGVVRRDIRSSFGGLSGSADGIPLTIDMRVCDASDGYVEKPGAAVYLWHCDRLGRYSLYSSGVTNQNWLRGVQVADENGLVQFTSIFPGCYSGRWPHIHFEVYPSLAAATAAGNKIATSQMAMPADACAQAYATSSYSSSKANLAGVSLATDNVFRDGATHQIPTVTGDATNGYVSSFVFAVA